VRALVVTNLYPSAEDPGRGSFVRDQVEALRRLPGLEVEVFSFPVGGLRPYVAAGLELRRRFAGQRFDVVHAHFGLTLWPSLAVRGAPHAVTLHGTDLVHPRSRAITLAGLPLMDLVAPVSEPLRQLIPRRALRGRLDVLPCGVATDRFVPIDRMAARRQLGLDEAGPYLLFPADPARSEKRFDRARELAGQIRLLALDRVEPNQVPLWVNAANAVLVPSERESFGLAVLEALACQVPVLATPVGVAPQALAGVQGCYCGEFDPAVWRVALEPAVADPDPRIDGRGRAEAYSAERMAERVYRAWQGLAGSARAASQTA
jgi:glycosyltransferase involved in cell wall biosynthesis